MGHWGLRAAIVAVFCAVAASALHYGKEFTQGLRVERAAYAASEVPSGALAALDGQTEAINDRLPVHLVNTTDWHMTTVTLAFETTDRKAPLSTKIIQKFDDGPWAPGAAIERAVRLAANWNGRKVHYSVISAVGFH